MPDCSAESVRDAIGEMRDKAQRTIWTHNAVELGRREMNWDKGREVLEKEYTRLTQGC